MLATDGGDGRAFVALSRTNVRALPPGYRDRIARAWAGPVELLYEARDEPRLRGLARVVRSAGRYDAVVLDGSVGLNGGYLDLLVAAAIRRRADGPVVVIADCQWELGASLADRAAMRLGLRLVDGPEVTYCVHSNEEVGIFPRTWGVDPERVAFTPWPYILSDDELAVSPEEPGIFAGGDSFRDYEPLLDAARDVPAAVTIATRQRGFETSDPPPNVSVGALSHEEYIARLRAAPIVVVPLVPTEERSAGQTTYVNALAMGKLVVVTDCLGVRDYIEPGVTGLIVPPSDARALRETLQWATDPANAAEVRRIRDNARASAQARFRPDDYVASLLRIAVATRKRVASRQ